MFRPIIIIGRLAGENEPHKALYLGDDAAAAEATFAELSALPEFAELAIYYYPTPRQTVYPASAAAVAELSRGAQRDVAAEERAAAIRERARAKVKALTTGQINAQALAEAEREIAAEEAAATTTPAAAAEAAETAQRVAEKVVDVIRDELTPQADPAPTAEPVEPAPAAEDDPAARFGAPAPEKPAKKPGARK